MKVGELMTKNLVTAGFASLVAEAAKKMLLENVGTVLVTDNGQLKGIVTDRQITTKVIGAGKDASRVKVSDLGVLFRDYPELINQVSECLRGRVIAA